MRAGNVIGGGDFAADRIIPDCVRAGIEGKDIIIRNPYSIRPFQHVLEPVMAYLMVAMKQYEDITLAGSYNIGPSDEDCWETGKLTELFCSKWQEIMGSEISWLNQNDGGPHEAGFLKLNCSKVQQVFGWYSKWNMATNVERIVKWTKVYIEGSDVEVQEYMN